MIIYIVDYVPRFFYERFHAHLFTNIWDGGWEVVQLSCSNFSKQEKHSDRSLRAERYIRLVATQAAESPCTGVVEPFPLQFWGYLFLFPSDYLITILVISTYF